MDRLQNNREAKLNINIQIDGIQDKLQLLNDAFLTGRCKLTNSIDLVFSGSPIPIVNKGTDWIDLQWKDRVEIDLPGWVDPDVDYVRVWKDRAEIRFKVGGKVKIR